MSIKKFLLEKGVKLTSRGFDYIEYALELCKKDKTYLYKITMRLYPAIAKKFETSASKVERAIRSAKSMHDITNGAFIKWCLIEMEE